MTLMQHQKDKIKLAFMAVIFCFALSQTALAGIAPSPCDPKYYDSLKSRAWLEAQREITQNQNLIYKPDSVLEYTCYDRYLNVLAGNAHNMFSETTRWGASQTNMQTALQNVVGEALGTYLAANFNHSFLGGRIALDHTPNPAVARDTNYTCTNMAEVWAQAKCIDFIQNGTNDTTDGFFTFENYRDTPDKRTLPTACANPDLRQRWTNEISLSTVNDFTPWEETEVKTYFDLLDPANCSKSLQIPTGIVVLRSKLSPIRYREKVCVASGCRYVPTGENTGTCQS